VKELKGRGFVVNKNYEKKQNKPVVSQTVPSPGKGTAPTFSINTLLDKIKLYETALETEP
jgi:hypothetical protein